MIPECHPQIFYSHFTLGLTLQLSKPVIKHLIHIVDALTTKGFSGTLTDIHYWSFH
ncbi:IS701 family transposase, partial [Geobacillus stearothermophilus]